MVHSFTYCSVYLFEYGSIRSFPIAVFVSFSFDILFICCYFSIFFRNNHLGSTGINPPPTLSFFFLLNVWVKPLLLHPMNQMFSQLVSSMSQHPHWVLWVISRLALQSNPDSQISFCSLTSNSFATWSVTLSYSLLFTFQVYILKDALHLPSALWSLLTTL